MHLTPSRIVLFIGDQLRFFLIDISVSIFEPLCVKIFLSIVKQMACKLHVHPTYLFYDDILGPVGAVIFYSRFYIYCL